MHKICERVKCLWCNLMREITNSDQNGRQHLSSAFNPFPVRFVNGVVYYSGILSILKLLRTLTFCRASAPCQS
jgi:hypothetical protein